MNFAQPEHENALRKLKKKKEHHVDLFGHVHWGFLKDLRWQMSPVLNHITDLKLLCYVTLQLVQPKLHRQQGNGITNSCYITSATHRPCMFIKYF